MQDIKQYILKYTEPALANAQLPNADDLFCYNAFGNGDNAWQNRSLPIGNGMMGANIFGGTVTERIQITENSFANPMYEKVCGAGLNNLAEIYIDFNHDDFVNYERSLHLNEAVAGVSYTCNGIGYKREYIASTPDNIIAVKLSAQKDGKLSFKLRMHVPFVREYCFEPIDKMGKQGTVRVEGNTVILESHLDVYNVIGTVASTVVTDGVVTMTDNGYCVTDAKDAVVYISVGTNYKLCEQVFLESVDNKKLEGFAHPYERVINTLNSAVARGFTAIKNDHIKYNRNLFERVNIDLGGKESGKTTLQLLQDYRNGKQDIYLQELLFQYGRYLLIASCCEGSLPPNLQGIWNQYASSPWTSGYWHNVNIQMNYWPAFSGNLIELFRCYVDYYNAYLPLARKRADDFVREWFPENYSGEGKNGWGIGTGAWAYDINALNNTDHSGPGTLGFTAMLFWDYYDFTKDEKILKEIVYPALYEASLFMTKIMVFEDGKWLVKYSASCEQWEDGKTYRTMGCTFDQAMCEDLFKNTVAAAEILGINDHLIDTLKERIPLLDVYHIGADGQIKEYREENHYGEIGEKLHRHISHLLGIYPGTRADFGNEELMNAAKVTTKLRGDSEIGWAIMQRLCTWARLKEPDNAYHILNHMIKGYILDNLWNGGVDPYNIDANFGLTAGISEMLLHSHRGYLEIIPTVPNVWKDGSFSGLLARGAFKVSAKWTGGRLVFAEIISLAGEKLKLFIPCGATAECSDEMAVVNEQIITVDTKPNQSISFAFKY